MFRLLVQYLASILISNTPLQLYETIVSRFHIGENGGWVREKIVKACRYRCPRRHPQHVQTIYP